MGAIAIAVIAYLIYRVIDVPTRKKKKELCTKKHNVDFVHQNMTLEEFDEWVNDMCQKNFKTK